MNMAWVSPIEAGNSPGPAETSLARPLPSSLRIPTSRPINDFAWCTRCIEKRCPAGPAACAELASLARRTQNAALLTSILTPSLRYNILMQHTTLENNSAKMNDTITLKRTRPFPARRASGTCAWVSRLHHVLRINHTRYTLVPADTHYRLVNWESGEVYDIDSAGRWCTCPSFVWDHCPVQAGGDGRCKHIAALRTLGLLPEAPELEKSA